MPNSIINAPAIRNIQSHVGLCVALSSVADPSVDNPDVTMYNPSRTPTKFHAVLPISMLFSYSFDCKFALFLCEHSKVTQLAFELHFFC